MEVIKIYPEIEELLFSIDRIANNLDEMTEIMKTSDKVTPDHYPEILRSEIQDLKLENDRFKKREEILMHFLNSCRCDLECKNCMFLAKDNYCAFPVDAEGIHWKLIQCSIDTIKELEDL